MKQRGAQFRTPRNEGWRLEMKRILSGIALALLCVPALFAQTPEGQKPAMMPDCAAMMQQHEAMQKHMATMNAKLQTLVDEMNAAKGSARVDKTAAVVTELVAQRAMMQKEMMDMQPKMMEHMMAHMQTGMKGMSMSDCPMMKESNSAAPAQHKH
jgi:polyhydroxyalkanoate synthesis regulator phasin